MQIQIDTLFGDPVVRRQIIDGLDHLMRAGKADCSLIAVPTGNRDTFRVVTSGLRDVPFGEVSLPIVRTALCARVVEACRVVAVKDARQLPPDEACSFLQAENFTGYIGAPIDTGDPRPCGVIASVTHEPRNWQRSDVAMIEQAAIAIATLIVGRGRSRKTAIQ